MIRFSSPSLPLVFSNDNSCRSSTVHESRGTPACSSPITILIRYSHSRLVRTSTQTDSENTFMGAGRPLVASMLNTICIFHRWLLSVLFQEQQEEDETQQQPHKAPFNPSEFFGEINRFKSRLHSLERERYELEEKVRRFQVCSSCLHLHRCENSPFSLLIQTQNTVHSGYSNYVDDDWNGFRSISLVNGRITPSTVVGKKCLVTQ